MISILSCGTCWKPAARRFLSRNRYWRSTSIIRWSGACPQNLMTGALDELSHILLDHALLAEGSQLDNPAEYVHRMNKLLLDIESGVNDE